jgi:arginine decarboxylase
MQTILSRNLPSETYEILKKYLDDNSYLKTIRSYYDDE